MKISLGWLSHFCDIHEQLDTLGTEQLAHKYSIHTAEIDDIISHGIEGVVVGKVLSVDSHPNSDKLQIVHVSLGDYGEKQIICGAANVVDAHYVPVAKIGTQMAPDFVIKKAKLRGEESEGMICSADELGLQQDRAEGILILEQIWDEQDLESHI